MNTQANTPGKGLLIGSGVVMLIFGVIELIGAVALSNAPFAVRIALELAIGLSLNTIVTLGVFFALTYIVLGIVGLVYCGNPGKAWYLSLEGIGILVLQIISIVVFSRHIGINILSFIGPGVIILFIIGANMNKNALQEEPKGLGYSARNASIPAKSDFCTSCGAKFAEENLAFCQSCGAKALAKAPPGQQRVWICAQCGDENPFTLTTCKSCRIDMPSDVKSTVPIVKAPIVNRSAKWRCSQCNEENPVTVRNCKGCGKDK